MDRSEAVTPPDPDIGSTRLPSPLRRRRVGLALLAVGGVLVSATALAFGIGVAFDRPRTLMAPVDYLAAKTSIETDSRNALDQCLILEGTALGVCRAQVQADERTRRAMLEVQYLGTVDAAESARVVKAEAEYDVAVAKCDAREGNARLQCLKLASTEKTKLQAPTHVASSSQGA